MPAPGFAQAAGAPPTAAAPSAPAAAVPAASAPVILPTVSAPAPNATSAAAPSPAPDAAAIAFTLPRDLSPWGMFMAADVVVKAVMVGLAFASVLSWTIWFAKAIELLAASRRLRTGVAALGEAHCFAEAAAGSDGDDSGVAELVAAAATELRLSTGALAPEGIKERIASRLSRLEAAAGRRMIRGTGILASIGATAPFVGLFGTVWGIMNSFIGISKAHTTNLAVVAPGIAEALLATALGLVAAIPAVVMYNMFSRWIGGYRALHADAAAEILRLVGRDLDRGAFDSVAAASRRPAAAAE